MSLQDTPWSPPSTCFRLKSQYNSWLGFDTSGNAAFLKQQDRSSVFFLLPCKDGSYMLQMLSRSLIELQESSNVTSRVIGSYPVDESGAWQGYGELTDSECWFFCKQGQLMSVSHYAQECHEDYLFSLEFDEYGCVALSSGLSEKGYWTLGSSGMLLFGVQSIGKRETFKLHEYNFSVGDEKDSDRVSMAPVRVNLKAHTGKYLCCAAIVISAAAEAPCCCEEFLLDVYFPPLLPCWRSCNSTIGHDVHIMRKHFDSFNSSKSRVRSGNGMLNWSAGADGKLITLQHDEAQGHEHFTVEVLPHKRHSMVSIGHSSSEASLDRTCYVSVEPSSKVTCNKLHKRKWEEFDLELVNESKFLIQSVHGYFMGSQEASMHINASSLPRYTSCTYEISPSSNVMAWRLRAHGDSCYTLVAATYPSDRGDYYLYVDGRGRALQSNEPGVHFPSLASLFEIKPVSRAFFVGASEGCEEQLIAKNAIIGFTIKTIRKINGKQRYFSVEPSGALRVNSVRVSRWEVFRLLDVDATAYAVLPNEFSCLPAALNLRHARIPISSLSPFQNGSIVVRRMTSSPLYQGLIRREFKCSNHLSGKLIQSVASMKKASQVAAIATRTGQCTPAIMPASLQELCINQLCLQMSAEVMKSEDNTHAVAWGTECLLESCLDLPDDLSAKIIARWCARQRPESSCKSLSSISNLSHNSRIGDGVQGPSNASERSYWESNEDGFFCHSCSQKGVLKMSPRVNPAHHRYLEVQYHAQNGLAQPTGFLWNLISFAGVSIMSTALLCHFFGSGNKKRRSSKSV